MSVFRHATRYTFGSEVFLKVRDERVLGMVTGITLRPTGTSYGVTWGNGSESWHYEFELTKEYAPSYTAAADCDESPSN